MIYLLPLPVTILWMVGGQIAKGARRFGVPGIVVMFALWQSFRKVRTVDKKAAWTYLVFLLFMPILAMGYGINSVYMKVFKQEWLVRAMYALTLSLPFLLYMVLTREPLWQWGVAAVVLVGAFAVRADKLGTIGKFDFLIEDIVRGMSFGGLLVWMII